MKIILSACLAILMGAAQGTFAQVQTSPPTKKPVETPTTVNPEDAELLCKVIDTTQKGVCIYNRLKQIWNIWKIVSNNQNRGPDNSETVVSKPCSYTDYWDLVEAGMDGDLSITYIQFDSGNREIVSAAGAWGLSNPNASLTPEQMTSGWWEERFETAINNCKNS